jgi:hypothetical protein
MGKILLNLLYRINMRFLFCLVFITFSTKFYSQACCSGGSGSPIAGGASQGVLQERQMEISANYQYFGSGKFKTGNQDTAELINYLYSNYLYGRLAYGITKDLTMSVEAGYYANKTEIALGKKDTITSKGIGDLILFPRYDIINRNTENTRTEVTLGLGYKIPLGTYNDSFVVYQNPGTLQRYYTTSPPTVQPTTGSQDLILYGFLFHGWPHKQFRVFSNILYIKKGWNPLGQKFGDYASVGLFVSKTFWEKLGVTLQVRGEWVDKMKYDKNIDMLALYNIDVNSTGSKKIFIVPQISFTIKDFTIYGLYEYPLYQYVNRVQIVSEHQITAGLAYRFFFKKRDTETE